MIDVRDSQNNIIMVRSSARESNAPFALKGYLKSKIPKSGTPSKCCYIITSTRITDPQPNATTQESV